MTILAHRGFWASAEEKNTEVAIRRAFANGYGIETDLRDCDGDIVVSHEMPRRGQMTFERLLEIHAEYGASSMLALNVKADGLHRAIANALDKFCLASYFVFDMSIPDTLGYLTRGITTFTRRSEFEPGSTLDERAQGLWLDTLETPYVDPVSIRACMLSGRPIAIVSPELHKRPHEFAWSEWRRSLGPQYAWGDRIMLCTDFPDQAADFFNQQLVDR
jgi:hypothetical protein